VVVLLVDRTMAESVGGATIDYEEDQAGPRFVVKK